MEKLKQIKELEQQKKDLEEYYKPEGKFQQELKQLADTTLELVENFYIFVVTFRTVANELHANMNILMLSQHYKDVSYINPGYFLTVNVIEEQFEIGARQLYQNVLSIQNRSSEEKVNMSCKYLE